MKKILLICEDISRNRKVVYEQRDLIKPFNNELIYNLSWGWEDHQIVLSCWKKLPLEISRIILDDVLWFYFYHRLYDQVFEILKSEKDCFKRFLKKFKTVYEDDDIFLQVCNIMNLYKSLEDGLSMNIETQNLYPIRLSFTAKDLAAFYSVDWFQTEKIFLKDVGKNYHILNLGDMIYDVCMLKGNSLNGYIHTDFFYHPVFIFKIEEFNPFDNYVDLDTGVELFRNIGELPNSIKIFLQSLFYLYGKNTGVFLMFKDNYFGQILINITI